MPSEILKNLSNEFDDQTVHLFPTVS